MIFLARIIVGSAIGGLLAWAYTEKKKADEKQLEFLKEYAEKQHLNTGNNENENREGE